jgi:hypothetical protein
MTARGQRDCGDADERRVRQGWIRGDSTTLHALPPFDHVVMGRSFHWMDRRAVLGKLDDLLPSGGAVALIGPVRLSEEPWQPSMQPWQPVERRVCEDFDLEISAAANCFHATEEHHHDVLAASPFSHLQSRTFTRRLVWDVEGLVGLQLSYSYSSPSMLGDRLHAFVEALSKALLADNPTGRWEQELTTEVLVARRRGRTKGG